MATNHYDAVIVGSGFGGSVMAYELATAGMRVCVLERGQSYPPGSFARTPFRMGRNFWDPTSGRFGLFDVWSFQHSEAVVASGLGGGSLIYANVLIRKPEEWFVEKRPDGSFAKWPIGRQDLEPHYDHVERVLGAQKYPLHVEPYASTSKTIAFRDAAHDLKLHWELPNLAVAFSPQPGAPPMLAMPIHEAQPNLHGRVRHTCRLCGECDVGCNYGSKNTLDYTYLTLASHARPHPCEILTNCEVKQFRPRDGRGYVIDYVVHDPSRPKPKEETPAQVTADRLVLAAGTLGTTYLMLKNRANLPQLNARALGTGYCTNGDLLTFVMRCRDKTANPAAARVIDAGRGPVITSTVRVDIDAHRGFLIQDAGYPDFVSWLIEVADARKGIRRRLGIIWRRLVDRWWWRDRQSEIDGQLAELIGPCELSSGSLPLLGMGRDTADGTMSLERSRRTGKDYLQVDWQRRGSADFFDEVHNYSQRMALAMGGTFTPNPATEYLKRLVTVHPLGGCPMATEPGAGVVDTSGRVVDEKGRPLPGLYIADGSVMPGSVGANPSLTIAAVSRMFALGIADRFRLGQL